MKEKNIDRNYAKWIRNILITIISLIIVNIILYFVFKHLLDEKDFIEKIQKNPIITVNDKKEAFIHFNMQFSNLKGLGWLIVLTSIFMQIFILIPSILALVLVIKHTKDRRKLLLATVIIIIIASGVSVFSNIYKSIGGLELSKDGKDADFVGGAWVIGAALVGLIAYFVAIIMIIVSIFKVNVSSNDFIGSKMEDAEEGKGFDFSSMIKDKETEKTKK